MTPVQQMLMAGALCAAAQFWVMPSHAADAPGALPGDAAMTCQQIATELAPYAQQMMGDATQLADTDQQIVQRGQQRVSAAVPLVAAESAAATAASLDPTGMASKAQRASGEATQERIWKQTEAEDKPLTEKAKEQTQRVVEKGTAMQSNARLQRLMQLAQEKNCQ